MTRSTLVVGVGMTPFTKPGRSAAYDAMAASAVRQALADAALDYSDVEQAYAGYVYGDSACGQRALYPLGMTGIPVLNVNNNCASGSSALFLARQAVASGAADCVLAFGFEQMAPGAIGNVYDDRPSPLDRFTELAQTLHPAPDAYMAPHMFGGAGAEYIERYGARPATFAKIAVKARRHAEHNERALFREPVSVEQVLASPVIFGPMTRLQCCPPTCGAAAAIVVSETYARRRGLEGVRILGQAMATDFASTFEARSMIKAVGFDLSASAAATAYEQAGVGPQDIDVCELHDCFTANELLSYEALGLAPTGGAEQFIEDGDNSYGGRVVTNPSGGLISKGHPLGATGLAQCTELIEQLRGRSGRRQVDGARLALQHNFGLGGACVVTVYGAA
ncbi:lipid-transfer protein [Solimonas marina]|uniref:propanoyl-CoA C-acyltransferase n=1 Tax=Solimonas marina TaxID=2714601 RepID=A0A970B411_9GAMM|nr:lipid-transfer protein [Solimonas marina]NKF21847.1 lipid-transfer protein [Solimonas marina]